MNTKSTPTDPKEATTTVPEEQQDSQVIPDEELDHVAGGSQPNEERAHVAGGPRKKYTPIMHY